MTVVFGGALTRSILFTDGAEVQVSMPSAMTATVVFNAGLPDGGTVGQVMTVNEDGVYVWASTLNNSNTTIDGGLI